MMFTCAIHGHFSIFEALSFKCNAVVQCSALLRFSPCSPAYSYTVQTTRMKGTLEGKLNLSMNFLCLLQDLLRVRTPEWLGIEEWWVDHFSPGIDVVHSKSPLAQKMFRRCQIELFFCQQPTRINTNSHIQHQLSGFLVGTSFSQVSYKRVSQKPGCTYRAAWCWLGWENDNCTNINSWSKHGNRGTEVRTKVLILLHLVMECHLWSCYVNYFYLTLSLNWKLHVGTAAEHERAVSGTVVPPAGRCPKFSGPFCAPFLSSPRVCVGSLQALSHVPQTRTLTGLLANVNFVSVWPCDEQVEPHQKVNA